MSPHERKLAVYPGTFDPITLGHLDVIERGGRIFDEVIVAVGWNPDKRGEIFTQAERVEMIRRLVSKWPNVRVEAYRGLTYEFVKKVGGAVILRGIRDSVDLRTELLQANTNLLAGGVETVFILASHDHALTSSSLIKQIVALGGDAATLTRLVPSLVAEQLMAKLQAGGLQFEPEGGD